jgi:hypothetical protein
MISYLSSAPVMAASRACESRGMVILQFIYQGICAFRGCVIEAKEYELIDGYEIDDVILGGDADHYGGGKTDISGESLPEELCPNLDDSSISLTRAQAH